MLESGNDPARIVNERGLKQTSDTGTIEVVIADVMAANADKVAEYRSGKDKLFGFFVGQTMKAMQGKRSEEHTSELQSLMRISYAVFCLKNKQKQYTTQSHA